MWLGQFACEGANWILKRAIKQERPVGASSLTTLPSIVLSFFFGFVLALCRQRRTGIWLPFISQSIYGLLRRLSMLSSYFPTSVQVVGTPFHRLYSDGRGSCDRSCLGRNRLLFKVRRSRSPTIFECSITNPAFQVLSDIPYCPSNHVGCDFRRSARRGILHSL